jgi:drug/metabolite transporter (DMT)-like permease
VYSVSVKRVAAEIGSTVSFGIVGLFTTIVLFFLAWKWGNLGHWWKVPWHVNAIMLFSGVLCIGIAHSLYYFTLRTIGVSICSTMLLTTPFFTMFISQWLFHEKLTGLQILSGAVLLGGGALTMLAKEPSLTIARAAESADA